MFKIINSDELVPYDEVRKKYQGYMVLMIEDENDRNRGKVFAISDNDGVSDISEYQCDFHEKGIRTFQLNNLVGGVNVDTLTVVRCEVF